MSLNQGTRRQKTSHVYEVDKPQTGNSNRGEGEYELPDKHPENPYLLLDDAAENPYETPDDHRPGSRRSGHNGAGRQQTTVYEVEDPFCLCHNSSYPYSNTCPSSRPLPGIPRRPGSGSSGNENHYEVMLPASSSHRPGPGSSVSGSYCEIGSIPSDSDLKSCSQRSLNNNGSKHHKKYHDSSYKNLRSSKPGPGGSGSHLYKNFPPKFGSEPNLPLTSSGLGRGFYPLKTTEGSDTYLKLDTPPFGGSLGNVYEKIHPLYGSGSHLVSKRHNSGSGSEPIYCDIDHMAGSQFSIDSGSYCEIDSTKFSDSSRPTSRASKSSKTNLGGSDPYLRPDSQHSNGSKVDQKGTTLTSQSGGLQPGGSRPDSKCSNEYVEFGPKKSGGGSRRGSKDDINPYECMQSHQQSRSRHGSGNSNGEYVEFDPRKSGRSSKNGSNKSINAYESMVGQQHVKSRSSSSRSDPYVEFKAPLPGGSRNGSRLDLTQLMGVDSGHKTVSRRGSTASSLNIRLGSRPTSRCSSHASDVNSRLDSSKSNGRTSGIYENTGGPLGSQNGSRDSLYMDYDPDPSGSQDTHIYGNIHGKTSRPPSVRSNNSSKSGSQKSFDLNKEFDEILCQLNNISKGLDTNDGASSSHKGPKTTPPSQLFPEVTLRNKGTKQQTTTKSEKSATDGSTSGSFPSKNGYIASTPTPPSSRRNSYYDNFYSSSGDTRDCTKHSSKPPTPVLGAVGGLSSRSPSITSLSSQGTRPGPSSRGGNVYGTFETQPRPPSISSQSCSKPIPIRLQTQSQTGSCRRGHRRRMQRFCSAARCLLCMGGRCTGCKSKHHRGTPPT